jgi:hypothetical protein
MQDNGVPGSRLLPDGSMIISINTNVKRPRAKAHTENQKKQSTKAKQPRKVLKTTTNALRTRADVSCLQSIGLLPCDLWDTYLHNLPMLLPNSSTQRTYIRNLTLLRQICKGQPIAALLLPTPQPLLRSLMEASQTLALNPWTIKCMLTALLNLLRSVLSKRAKAKPEVVSAIRQLSFAHRHAKRAAVRLPKDGSGWLSHQQLCATRDSITNPTQEKLLLAFLTATAPRIKNLHNCRIFCAEPTEPELDDYSAYIILPENASTNQRCLKPCIVYHNNVGPHTRVKLPHLLTELIKSSLQHEPRQFLFGYTRHAMDEPQPYAPRSFANWCSIALKDITGNKNATIKLATQAFITHYLNDNNTKAKPLADALNTTISKLKKQCVVLRDTPSACG